MSCGAPPPTYGYSEDGVRCRPQSGILRCRAAVFLTTRLQVRSGALSSRFSYYCRRGKAVDYLKVPVPFTYYLHGNAVESRHLKHPRAHDY